MNDNPTNGRAVDFDERLGHLLVHLTPGGSVPDADTAALIADFGASVGWPELEFQTKVADREPQRFGNPAHRAQAIMDASNEASQRLEYLRSHAGAGDEAALSLLVQLLVENATWLEGYSSRDKGNLKAMARISNAWPVVMDGRAQRAKDVADHLKRIELSARAQISLSQKWGTTWHGEGNVASFYAQEIRNHLGKTGDWVRANRDILPTSGPLSGAAWAKLPQWVKDAGKLPPLTKHSAPQWFEIGWQLILKKHGGHPEGDKQLRKLGLPRANKYALSYGTKDRTRDVELQQRKESPPRTASADIRSGIRERILQALVSLAPDQ